ncbi:MAG: FAD-dependent oxidoreductase [Acidobacteriota bacterium]
MSSSVARVVHPAVSGMSLAVIVISWISTVAGELLGSRETVVMIKTAIPWGLLVLVPALIGSGVSGALLAAGQARGAIGAKARRMPFIVANGLFVLVPSALFLAARARVGQFDHVFQAVQAVELVAGTINIILMGMSMRDGLRAARWRSGRSSRPVVEGPLSFLRREEIADGTGAFFFQKPPAFDFTAGQAVYVTLPELEQADAGGRRRVFSIASAPSESQLMLATRRSDTSFKAALWGLEPGARVSIEGPYGSLGLGDASTSRTVLLAGGVGITPFRSMILQAVESGLARDLTLFYSNRAPGAVAFLEELTELARTEPRFTLVATMTDEDTDWHGEKGPISIGMLKRHLVQLEDAEFHVAGPPAMVTELRRDLSSSGVAGGRIHSEGFDGY